MNRLLITIFIVLAFSKKIVSQTKYLDSIHISKIHYFRDINSDSTIYYCNKLKNSNDICKKLKASTSISYAFYRARKYDKAEEIAIDVINRVTPLIEKEKLNCLLDAKISAYNRLFWIKKNQEDYNKAYLYLTLMEKTNEMRVVKDPKFHYNKITVENSKAIIKMSLKMERSAKDILLNIYKNLKFIPLKEYNDNNHVYLQRAHIINTLGNIYMTLSDKEQNPIFIDSASYFYDKAFEVTKFFNPLHKDSEILYNFKKTEVLMAKKQHKKAIELINNYKHISNGYPYFHREYFQKAICYNNLNNSDSAIYYSNKLLKDSKKCEPSKLITIYDILSNQYNHLHKLDSALKYSRLTLDGYNLVRNNKDKTFNLFYNNNYNKAQQLNNTIKEKETEKQSKLIIAFTALLLTLVILTFYLLNGEKKKKKELLLKIHENKPVEIEKKAYNIDKVLEDKILNEFKNTSKNLDFLRPDFSTNYIADKLNTNTTYISFVFNKYHDESFKQYSTKLKINFVVEKLKTDKVFRKYSIQAIAEEIGYTNASAFTRAFKKHVGVTPSAFLKDFDNN
ncbi:helix-turn-helix domain-containing protein [Tenacibaculum sp.]|uniref:helix-turn-helix domain-containing protein n=1 Tax=Tenacibaculum sp. TaxID=1906242 RepID=UPI003D0C141B